MDTRKRLEDEFNEFISQDNFPYYFYIHDAEGVFTYVSPDIIDVLGYTPDEFNNFYMNCATANPLNKEMIKYTHRALNGIQQDPYMVEVYDKEYNTHYLNIYEKPVFEDGKVVAVEGVAKLLS